MSGLETTLGLVYGLFLIVFLLALLPNLTGILFAMLCLCLMYLLHEIPEREEKI